MGGIINVVTICPQSQRKYKGLEVLEEVEISCVSLVSENPHLNCKDGELLTQGEAQKWATRRSPSSITSFC